MAFTSRVMGGGTSAGQALAIAGGAATALVAAGTTTTDALVLGALAVQMIGTAAASSGVRLPAGAPGDSTTIFNGGANACTLYPTTGAKFNALSANTGVSMAVGSVVTCYCVSATQWIVNASA